jgi:hypothetical protein
MTNPRRPSAFLVLLLLTLGSLLAFFLARYKEVQTGLPVFEALAGVSMGAFFMAGGGLQLAPRDQGITAPNALTGRWARRVIGSLMMLAGAAVFIRGVSLLLSSS